MKRKNPEKKDDGRKERNWWEEDTQKPDETPLLDENLEMIRKTSARLITGVLVFALILIALIFLIIMQWNSQEAETETSGTITVTGNQEMVAGLVDTSAETEAEQIGETQKEIIPEETEMEEAGDWQRVIFGSGISQAIVGTLKLNGMTDGMRDAVNFRESDFLTGAAVFLAEQKVSANQITIEEELPCSSDGAIAYLAELQGINDQALIIILYPDYPGKFQFLLMDSGAVNSLVETKSVEVPQTEEIPQTETLPVVVAPTQAETQAAQTEPHYDATRLSITGLPGILDNYINNRYELQYSLYDYLYHNGYRQVSAAAVSDYAINGDERTATISFLLSDGRTITGIYSKDSNSYSFY